MTTPRTVDELTAAYPPIYKREGNFITVRARKRKIGDELYPVPYDNESPKRLHAGQLPIWYARQRHLFMIAGTQGGKSYMGPLWMWRHIQRAVKRYPNATNSFGIVGPTLGDIQRREVGVGRMMQFFEDVFGWSDEIFNARLLTIDLTRVGIPAYIYTGSATHKHRLQGAHMHAIWIDEGGL